MAIMSLHFVMALPIAAMLLGGVAASPKHGQK